MKILLSEAENWVKAGRSKIYDDARKGLISTEKDPTRGNKKVVDTAELQRVYGEIQNPTDNPQRNPQRTKTDDGGLSDQLVQQYENRIQDLQTQLAHANDRETALLADKSKLLDLLSAEKDEKRELKAEMLALMPPPEEREQKTAQTQIKPRGWLQRLLGA